MQTWKVARFGSAAHQRTLAAATSALLLLAVGTGRAASGDEYWDARFFIPGVGGSVSAILQVDADLYVGGTFISAGGILASNIARWDGTNWHALGSGVNAAVSSLAVMGSDLVAAGSFTMAGGVSAAKVARWNGSTWSALGAGLDSWVGTLAVVGTNLYAGGSFHNADGAPANHIACWNGTAWSAVAGGLNDWVLALVADGEDLYAGGFFTSPSFHVARYRGGAWQSIGGGVGVNLVGYVSALARHDTELYAGGDFASASGAPFARNLARWDGTNWFEMHSEGFSTVHGLLFANGTLYAADEQLRCWDGTNWASPVQFNRGVTTLAVDRSGIAVGGSFTTADGRGMNGLAHLETNTLSPFGPPGLGVGDEIRAFARIGPDVFVGGNFTSAGDITAARGARWNGCEWAALGTGLNGSVNAMTTAGSDLYVAGRFTLAGDALATNVARWDGARWHPVGNGLTGVVSCVVGDAAGIYAGGAPEMGAPAFQSGLLRWDGAAWAVPGGGAGVEGTVSAITLAGGEAYAGGKFTRAGGIDATNLVRWDGTNWSAVGGGVIAARSYIVPVSALAWNRGSLYVAGSFIRAGSLAVTNLARWDGSTWFPVGPELPGDQTARNVQALAFYGGTLFVACNRIDQGPLGSLSLLRLEENRWTQLGSGLEGFRIQSLLVHGNKLLVGGSFLRAGGKGSVNCAIWHLLALDIEKVAGGTRIAWPAAASNYVLEATQDMSAGNWSAVSEAPHEAAQQLSLTNSVEGPRRFYRLRRQ